MPGVATPSSLYEAGRAAHPSIEIEQARFEAAVRGRDTGETPFAGDLYVAVGCELGIEAALAHLESEHFARLAALLRKIERDAHVIDEVVQIVRVRTLVAEEGPARIATYTGRGSLLGWLKVMAVRLHSNYHRDARRRPEHADLGSDVAEAGPSPDQLLLAGLAPIVSEALRASLRALPPRERTMLRLCYATGAGLDRIAAMYGVHKATISRWISAARERVLADALAYVRAATDLDADVVANACAQLESKLELSLSALYSTQRELHSAS